MTRFLRRQLQHHLIRSLLLLIRLMPRAGALALFGFLSPLAWRVLPGERRKVLFNLRLVFPETDPHALGRAVFRQMALNAVDAFRLPGCSAADLDRLVTVDGLEHFDRAYRAGRGIVVVTGHIGCWELMPAWFSGHGYRISVIGRRAYDDRLDRLLVGMRARHGICTIDRDRGAKQALRVLRQGQVLGILIDQDTRVSSIEADFFGQPARTPTGAAALAAKTGAAVIPMAIHRLPDGRHRVTVLPMLVPSAHPDREQRLREDVQRQIRAVEQLIRMDVTQWAWMHLRWTAKPPEQLPP